MYSHVSTRKGRTSPMEDEAAVFDPVKLAQPQVKTVDDHKAVRALDYDYGHSLFDEVDKHGYGGHHDDYGHARGHSSYGHDHHDVKECCPLVVDPLSLFSILGLLFGGTAFLNIAITMNITMRRRKRRSSSATSSSPAVEIFHSGRTLS